MCMETNTPTDRCKQTETQTITAGPVCYTNTAVYRIFISARENSVKVTAGCTETTRQRLQARYINSQFNRGYGSLD
jgi:hypothetical protein